MEVDGVAAAVEHDDRTFYVGPKAQMRRDFMTMANPLQNGLSMSHFAHVIFTIESSSNFFSFRFAEPHNTFVAFPWWQLRLRR
jgi:hypothetical protein